MGGGAASGAHRDGFRTERTTFPDVYGPALCGRSKSLSPPHVRLGLRRCQQRSRRPRAREARTATAIWPAAHERLCLVLCDWWYLLPALPPPDLYRAVVSALAYRVPRVPNPTEVIRAPGMERSHSASRFFQSRRQAAIRPRGRDALCSDCTPITIWPSTRTDNGRRGKPCRLMNAAAWNARGRCIGASDLCGGVAESAGCIMHAGFLRQAMWCSAARCLGAFLAAACNQHTPFGKEDTQPLLPWLCGLC